MKLNELRIGNLVYRRFEQRSPSGFNYVYSTYKIDLEDLKRIKDGLNDYSAIPLTEDWFLKFGYPKNGTDQIFIDNYEVNQFNLSNDEGFNFEIGGCAGRNEIVNMKYVHQLQNLYFALTETELTKND